MTIGSRPRVAVVGAGIAGLAAASGLSPHAQVTLYEAASHFGGHAHTVDVTLDGITHGVDTGFLVYNERTYPLLTRLFAALGVETAPSEMSFSVQSSGLEWAGTDLASVFAQRRNAVRPAFWRMLAEIVRFNRLAGAASDDALGDETIGDFLDRNRFGHAFRDGYFLPMIGCIWSCPTEQMLRFPVAALLRFCRNHGLLQLRDRPQWRTVRGGSQRYVERLVDGIADARASTPVLAVLRRGGGATVVTAAGAERYDEVVLACHSDQSLALLADADDAERSLLGAIRYQRNVTVLHTDAALLPRRRRAWAAWNYERAADGGLAQAPVCLHYWINRLQPLPWQRPVIVSLNPLREPDPALVLARETVSHPVFDTAALAAQRRLPALQGRAHTWFCGAWAGNGFHEDGLAAAETVVAALRTRLQHAATPAAASTPA